MNPQITQRHRDAAVEILGESTTNNPEQELLEILARRFPDWMQIESAPRDGTTFIGLKGNHVAPTRIGKYYVKWPYEAGGPTFKERWDKIQPGLIRPWNPTHWMPLPPTPDAKG